MKLQARKVIDWSSNYEAVLSSTFAGVSVAERHSDGCVLLTSVVDAITIFEVLSHVLGLTIPMDHGTISGEGTRVVSWLSPRSWLVHVPENEVNSLMKSVDRAFPEKRVSASHFSDHICWFDIEGDGVEDLLKQGGFISLEPCGLPVKAIKRTLVAGVPLLIWRYEKNHWRVGVERSRAQYFIDWMVQTQMETQGNRPRL